MCNKRVACNEVRLTDGRTYSPGVVELTNDGSVANVYQLEEELAQTIWISGRLDIRTDSKGNARAYKDNKEIK